MNLSWTKKNVSAKKMFKIGDEIDCVITEIEKIKEELQFHIDLHWKILLKLLKKNFQLEVLLKVRL